MAHPKKRTSKATKGQRNSHSALKSEQLLSIGSTARKITHSFVKAAKLGADKIRSK